jgi:pimeloyl-ACP methyl ester carboxylesterase
MHVHVNGVRLFVEVFGQKLLEDGSRMVERPTVVALHGGPSDHAHMRAMVAPLAEVAQVVLYDHRGCGRSEHGDPALWTMEQWGDDVRGLCDALGINKPIVVGASFGGFVAQSYAIRHPGHASKLGLLVTGPRHDNHASVEGFRKQGGDAAAALAAAMLNSPSAETFAAFLAGCRDLYTTTRRVDTDLAERSIPNRKLFLHYFGKIAPSFDFRAALSAITTPVLILGGDEDPILPPPFQDELEAALTAAPVRRVSFPNAGHFLHIDATTAYFDELRNWVTEPATAGT